MLHVKKKSKYNAANTPAMPAPIQGSKGAFETEWADFAITSGASAWFCEGGSLPGGNDVSYD
jgi:hypothetical protein